MNLLLQIWSSHYKFLSGHCDELPNLDQSCNDFILDSFGSLKKYQKLKSHSKRDSVIQQMKQIILMLSQ